MRRVVSLLGHCCLLSAVLAAVGCHVPRPGGGLGTSADPEGVPSRAAVVRDSKAPDDARSAPGGRLPHLTFNQHWVEGLHADPLDLDDVDAVFGHVFSRLPPEVVIYPSENYYYFMLHIAGRQVWGNIRLPAGQREQGELSFGYFEFNEFPQLTVPQRGLSQAKFYSAADGLRLVARNPFTWEATYGGKRTVFHLHRLSQETPARAVATGERFIQRTFDESGYQFYLLFHEERNYFVWVLNEESPVPDVLTPDAEEPDLLVGRRSGFAFWVDRACDDRKVLVAIRRLNSQRNDYFDGPFDQLADNYADETRVAEYMQRAAPTLRGRIDKYGYYKDQARPMRVALACYYSYLARSDLLAFLQRAREAPDPLQHISRRGYPLPESLPAATEGDALPEAPVPESPVPETGAAAGRDGK